MAKTIVPGGIQDLEAVVDEEGVFRVEGLDGLDPVPEPRGLLRQAQVMGADDPLQVAHQGGLAHLEGDGLLMGVGHQHAPPGAFRQGLEKFQNPGMDRDQVLDLFLEQGDVQAQFATPMVDAVPLQGALPVPVPGHEFLPGLRQLQAPGGRESRGDVLPPEAVVKMQIQQGPVHIEEDLVDLAPVDHRWRVASQTAVTRRQHNASSGYFSFATRPWP